MIAMFRRRYVMMNSPVCSGSDARAASLFRGGARAINSPGENIGHGSPHAGLFCSQMTSPLA